MAEMAHEKYRIAPTAGAGSESKASVLLNTVMGLIGMGGASPATQTGVRITDLEGKLVKEVPRNAALGAQPMYDLVQASWSTMTVEEFEGRWLS